MAGWEHARSGGPRWAASAAAVGLLVIAGLALARGGDRGGDLEVQHDAPPPSSEEASTAAGGPPAPAGQWEALEQAPLPGRLDHVAVWTGDELLVWGGRDAHGWRLDGATYDPSTRTWESIPDAPFPPYAGTRAVWDGRRLAVIGLRGGRHVAYEPATREWQQVSDPPEGRWVAIATLRGTVVLAGVRDGATAAVILDPGSGNWRALPRPPVDGGAYGLVEVGGRLVLLGPRTGEELAVTTYDPSTRRWSSPQDVPAGVDFSPTVGADTRRYRVLLAGPSHGRDATHAVRAWQVGSPGEGWAVLPGLPTSLSRAPPELIHTRRGMVAWAADEPAATALLGPEEDRWTPLALPPREIARGSSAVWTGRELLAWGGERGQGAAWTPRRERAVELPPPNAPRLSGSWRVLPAPPDQRRTPAAVWTGQELVVWGGLDDHGDALADGVALDPTGERWRAIDAAPLRGRAGATGVWLDGEVVVWGGRGAEGHVPDGAAYDPASDRWRLLPTAPPGLDGASVAAVVRGELMVAAGAQPAVAAYDPTRDAWRDVVDPPARAGRPVGLVETEQGALLLTEGSSWLLAASEQAWEPRGSHTVSGRPVVGAADGQVIALGGGQLARFEAERARWAGAARPWGDLEGAPAAWTGSRLVVWGATRVGDHAAGRRGAAAYEPSADEWRVLPDPPPGVAPEGPAVWTDQEVVFWSSRGDPIAFRPSDP